jgi:parallel beta-helix repeat protein
MKVKLPILVTLGLILISGCIGRPIREAEEEALLPPDIPTPPQLSPPEPVTLPELNQTYANERIEVSEDINASLFEGCVIEVWRKDGIRITNSRFINSKIQMRESKNIELSDSVIVDRYVREEPAIDIYDCERLLIDHNEIRGNSIGMTIAESAGIEISNNIFEANDQHNALVLGRTSAEVRHNLFRYSFPHAILIMNREADPLVQVNIYDNIMDRNIEDAINFEDFRGSERVSKVYNNRITGTGWAGINVEYNSWDANLVIEDNYIDNNGLLTEDILDGEGKATSIYPAHEHQPDPYSPGWQHGLKIEDSSGVKVIGNVILNNSGNGVDVKNGQDVILENNLIAQNAVGISLGGFQESSLSRQFSPLSLENAGYSHVIAINNSVFDNLEQDWFVEEGSCLEKGEE